MLVTLLLFIFGLAMRLINFFQVFPGGNRFYLFDPDCYMRLRKVMVYLAAFPKPLVFDYFQGFPQGTGIISAPLMEYLLAAILFPFTGRHIDEHILAMIMALIPPLIGGLTVALLYLLVKKLFDATSGVIAAIFLAFLPIHIESTLLGRFDNEMIEPLLLVLIISVYLKTYRSETVRTWLTFGLLQTIFVVLWRGALVPLAVIGLDILLRACRTKTWGRFNRQAASGYFLTAALIGLICLTNIWGTRDSFSYNTVSWFHVTLFAAAATFISIAGYLTADKRLPRVMTSLVLISVCIALLPYVKSGLLVAVGGNDWIDSISQYLPAYNDFKTIYSYGLFSCIAPIIAWLALKDEERAQLPRRFLLMSMVFFYLMALLRRRFGHFYAIESAIAAGMLPLLLQKTVGNRFTATPAKLICLSLIILFPLQAVTAIRYPALSLKTTGPIKGDLEESFLWLRNNTPPAGDPYHPDILPAYSVLTHWDLGGYLETIGQRPSVATSYGMETYGLEEAGRLFLAESSSELAAVLDRNISKYMILYNPIDKLAMYTKLLKVENKFIIDKWDAERKRFAYNPTAEALNLAIIRLYIADGSMVSAGSLLFQPIEGVRLVYESTAFADLGSFPWGVHQVKIFERVSGARLEVPALSGCSVLAEQQVVTNQGREFVYRNIGQDIGNGRMEITVAYPPKLPNSSVGAVGPTKIICGGRSIRVDIPADAIASGKTIHLSW